MAKFTDASGQLVEVDLGGVDLYKEAVAKRISVRQLINSKYDTQAGMPDAFQQMCYHAGMRFEKDPITGRPPSTLGEMLNPESAGTFTSKPGEPTSRILFPAAILATIEGALKGKHGDVVNALNSIVGFEQSVASSRFDQAVINFSGTGGPEDFIAPAISQNTAPALMMSITTGEYSRRIPTYSFGMEVSEESLSSTPADFISMALARQMLMASYSTFLSDLLLLLNGDADSVNTSYSTGKSALTTFKASSLDSTIVANGVLTHTAWIKYLLKNPLYMSPSHVVCDVNAALAIENRTGRPTNVQNDSTDRIDSPMELIWPSLGPSVKIIALPVGSFPANTLMGLQANSPAVARVTSLTAEYSGVEDVILKRSRVMRFDSGSILYRLYDNAFSVMSLVA